MNIFKNKNKLKKIADPRYLMGQVSHFLAHYLRLFTFVVIIALVGYCLYIWYGTIYQPEWSDSQKQAYIMKKGPETSFNQQGFEYDVEAAKKRAVESQKTLDNLTDIFRLNQGQNSSPNSTPAQK